MVVFHCFSLFFPSPFLLEHQYRQCHCGLPHRYLQGCLQGRETRISTRTAMGMHRPWMDWIMGRTLVEGHPVENLKIGAAGMNIYPGSSDSI